MSDNNDTPIPKGEPIVLSETAHQRLEEILDKDTAAEPTPALQALMAGETVPGSEVLEQHHHTIDPAYDFDYHGVLDQLGRAAATVLAQPRGAFFTTQVSKQLFDRYLHLVATTALEQRGKEYATAVRQQLNCSHCRRFFSRVAGVVYLDNHGAHSVYWNPDVVTDPVMKVVVAELKKFVEASRVKNLFDPEGSYKHYTEETNYGDKFFRHFYINVDSLIGRNILDGTRLRRPDKSKFHGQVEALIKFAINTPYTAVLAMDQWFQARDIEHVGGSEANILRLKGLLSSIATIKNAESYRDMKSDYDRETRLVNLIWRYALSDTELLAVKNSILGKTIALLVDDGDITPGRLEGIKKFWKEQTSGLNYMRTTAPASSNQVEKTLLFLQENDYMRSLEQKEAAEADIPVLWSSTLAYTERKPEPAAATSFAAFAAEKAKGAPVGNKMFKAAGITDPGFFFNEVLPHVVNAAMLLPRGIEFKPLLINQQADPTSKPLFKYDTPENPCRFVQFSYKDSLRLVNLIKPDHEMVDGRLLVNILSITTPSTIGVDASKTLMFMLDGLSVDIIPRPVLFATEVAGELYDHRRALEDYSGVGTIPRAETQQALGLCIGQSHPKAVRSNMAGLEVRVTYTPEHAVLMGCPQGIYQLDVNGFIVEPETTKFVRHTRNGVLPSEVGVAEEEVQMPAVTGGVTSDINSGL